MPELDTLRGCAVLLVLFFHGFSFVTGSASFQGPFRWFLLSTSAGWIGVNLFFVLSGFLITGILLDSRNSPRYYKNFYQHRALRILPAYYCALLLVLVVARTGLTARHVSWEFFGLSLVYLSNVTVLFGVPMQYGVLWSLAVEEHFYLAWPAVVRCLSRRTLVCVCSVLLVASAGLRAYCFWRKYDYGAGYTWLVLDGLAWGSLLAGLCRGRLSKRSRMLGFGIACAIGSAAVALALIPVGIMSSGTFVGGVFRISLINSFFAGIVGIALVIGTGPWKNIFFRPALKFFGEISYGLYLIHMLAFDTVDSIFRSCGARLPWGRANSLTVGVRFIVAATLSVGVAYLSRWYFEEPFLRLKKNIGIQAVRAEMPSVPALDTLTAS